MRTIVRISMVNTIRPVDVVKAIRAGDNRGLKEAKNIYDYVAGGFGSKDVDGSFLGPEALAVVLRHLGCEASLVEVDDTTAYKNELELKIESMGGKVTWS
jgi:hypothetical protein